LTEPERTSLDEKGFVRTGEVGGEKRHALETNRHGVFAIGATSHCASQSVFGSAPMKRKR
jgi:hypothetical protein